VWILVPQIASFGPVVPLCYSSAGSDPSNRFFWASSASTLFKCGLWSLELLLLGQPCLYVIRVWAPFPRIASFGPVVPLNYSSAGFDPSNRFFRASSSSMLFEYGPRSFYFLYLGHSASTYYSSAGFYPFNCFIRAISAFTLFECGLRPSNHVIRTFSASISIEHGFFPSNHYLTINAFTFA
jgi:hypothetical protein